MKCLKGYIKLEDEQLIQFIYSFLIFVVRGTIEERYLSPTFSLFEMFNEYLFLTRKRIEANTIIQTIKAAMLIRSHKPIYGVGRFLSTLGASTKVKTPNTMKTRIVRIE